MPETDKRMDAEESSHISPAILADTDQYCAQLGRHEFEEECGRVVVDAEHDYS